MANLIRIPNPAPRFNDNLLPSSYGINLVSGGSNYTVTTDSYGYDKESSIYIRSVVAGSAAVIDLTDYSVTIPKDGNYSFSVRLFKINPAFEWQVQCKIFVNAVLNQTFGADVYNSNGFEDGVWNTYGQSFAFTEGDEITFRYEVSTGDTNNYLYISAPKFEYLDKGFTVPSIYSYPINSFLTASSGVVSVSSLNDLPTPSAGVITLLDDVTYIFTNNLDLGGNRLVGGSNTNILGYSSENCSLTSTGLSAGVPLYQSIYTTPIRHISFKDVDTAIDFDGTSNPDDMALDFTGVNFVNVPNVGSVTEASNFIFDKGAFLNSKGLSFDGTIGTVGFGNCLFSGDGLAGDILKIESTCIITRRFRIIYSSVVSFSSTVGVNVDVSATIPVESYILDTINFSGGGTYLSGVSVTDNKTLFVNCKGISNSAEISQYYMNGNATATTISSVGVAVKVSGTTTSASVTQKFANINNRATYIGSFSRYFKITATLSFESGNNNQIGCYISKNGTTINESEVYGTTGGTGRSENVTIQALVELSTNDYIEIFVENATSITNITVTDLNVIVQ